MQSLRQLIALFGDFLQLAKHFILTVLVASFLVMVALLGHVVKLAL
jgi:hypothetical protein